MNGASEVGLLLVKKVVIKDNDEYIDNIFVMIKENNNFIQKGCPSICSELTLFMHTFQYKIGVVSSPQIEGHP
jgi:hypothetical protein